jgi:hypothetical protein
MEKEHTSLEVLFLIHWLVNSVAWVREWTIPTERPPLVAKVNASFCR